MCKARALRGSSPSWCMAVSVMQNLPAPECDKRFRRTKTDNSFSRAGPDDHHPARTKKSVPCTRHRFILHACDSVVKGFYFKAVILPWKPRFPASKNFDHLPHLLFLLTSAAAAPPLASRRRSHGNILLSSPVCAAMWCHAMILLRSPLVKICVSYIFRYKEQVP